MRFGKIVTIALLSSLIGGSLLSVAPVAGAESSADKIEVKVDGRTVSDSGVLVDGRAYVSVRQLQDTLRAFIYWDSANKRLTINKPNINLLLFQGKTPFGKVQVGKTEFSVLAQVDSLKVDVDSIRITITDPHGRTSQIQESSLSTKQDNFWFRSNDYKYDFKSKGEYTISCYLRQKDGEYTLLSEMKVEAVDKI